MSGYHHSQRLILAHAEFRFQNYDDELAGREVIIDQDDFMQSRPFDLYLFLDLALGLGSPLPGDATRRRLAVPSLAVRDRSPDHEVIWRIACTSWSCRGC
jgi:hypothetical protein